MSNLLRKLKTVIKIANNRINTMKLNNFIIKIHTSIGKTTIIQISNNKTMTYRDKE
jgi:replicative superfamily II helicase